MIVPISTYRVQLHKDFNFSRLRGIINYLDKLGIHTIYAAPVMTATPGSMHGYDVTDPHNINPEIGTLQELIDISNELKRRGMRWVQDIVPNHMAFSTHNTRLMDVLERGEYSPFYNYFDINWNHPDPALTGKVMVPFLGKDVDECIDSGEIMLKVSHTGLCVGYFESNYPLSVPAFHFLMKEAHPLMHEALANKFADYMHRAAGELTLEAWLSYKEQWMSDLISSGRKTNVDAMLTLINKDKHLLRRVLNVQYYRLCYWKMTERVINYRRFFTVNSLICLRMESETVFQEYHKFISYLYHHDIVQGVRIDHIDGLNDPSQYLKQIRKLLGPDCYIIAEKILEAKEEMPQHWPLEGTSGYEFLSYVNQLFTDRKGTEKLIAFYQGLLPRMPAYNDIVLLNKRLILNGHMAGEMENLTTYFFELGLQADFRRQRIKDALSLLMLSLPVYRIYPDGLPLSGSNLALMQEAFNRALQLNDEYKAELEYLESLCISGPIDLVKAESILLFLKRMMQFTGPLTAKGVEDTTFYIYNPLISHVEVGDAPSTLGIPIQEFHKQMIKRRQLTPYSLNATATHDTKRGEDARVRLNLLSEIPEEWIGCVNQWLSANRRFKVHADGREYPILNDEYFIYQSIVGGFPENGRANAEWVERLKQYIVKVVREAKVISTWESPNEIYEKACCDFIDQILDDGSSFLQTLGPLLETIFKFSNVYSVAQAVLKITAPGIPDIYQGCELLDLSYVDPDNRRPVNYTVREEYLDALVDEDSMTNPLFADHVNEGVLKLYGTIKCLAHRKKHPELFAEGAYVPLALSGSGGLAIAFARYHNDDWCIVILPFGLAKNRTNATDLTDNFISLPANSPREWRSIFTNEPIVIQDDKISLGEAFRSFPVVVLSNK